MFITVFLNCFIKCYYENRNHTACVVLFSIFVECLSACLSHCIYCILYLSVVTSVVILSSLLLVKCYNDIRTQIFSYRFNNCHYLRVWMLLPTIVLLDRLLFQYTVIILDSRSLQSFSRGHPYVRQTVRGSASVTGNSDSCSGICDPDSMTYDLWSYCRAPLRLCILDLTRYFLNFFFFFETHSPKYCFICITPLRPTTSRANGKVWSKWSMWPVGKILTNIPRK